MSGHREASAGMPSAPNREEIGVIVAEQTVGSLRNTGKAPALPREGTGTALPWGTLRALRFGQQHPYAYHLPENIPTTGLWKTFTARDL